uniref:(northern house mosquito) hypothetical protein n=1 Tax=Culex pipiens TaxID=7175 RepID=A0A8D8HS45_CULPI
MPSHTCIVCKLKLTFVKQKNLAVSFHAFPRYPYTKQAWIEFCGTDTGVVCSKHFSDDCFIAGREENYKRRRLFGWAVPTIRLPVKINGTSILSENSPEEISSSSLSETIQPEISESVDSKETTHLSADNIILTHSATISQLKAQVQEHKSKLEDTNKKLHEMERAIFERDCVIEDLRKTLGDVTRNSNSETLHVDFIDDIKIEENEFQSS